MARLVVELPEEENVLKDMALLVLIPVFFLILALASIPATISEHL